MWSILSTLGLLVLGASVGALGTLIGAGGGFLLVPILIMFFHVPTDIAAGTSLFVVLANAASGAASYARQGRVDYRSGAAFALATLPGAVLGARVSSLVAGRPFHILFALLLFAVAARLAVSGIAQPHAATRERADDRRRGPGWFSWGRVTRRMAAADETHEWSFSLPLGLGISLVAGFLSSILGIGGGIVHVPALVELLSYPMHIATATSHFVLAFTALAGVVAHAWQGTLDFRLAVPLGVGAAAGAPVGAWLSTRLSGSRISALLAVALAMVAVRLLIP
ncbi:MAG: sulfite exporter TauE/SafE family protein [Firmicutes bacterium]|nr:sulfite exporter TauE/SafE family protein [Bacillota bacterium]